MALLAIALLSLVAVAFATTASIRGPKTVRVGQIVTVKATQLTAGSYQLFLVTPYDNHAKPGQATQCTAAIGALRPAHGTASFSGRVPGVLDCRAKLVSVGKRVVTPGSYEFEIDAPVSGHPNRHLANVIEAVHIEK